VLENVGCEYGECRQSILWGSHQDASSGVIKTTGGTPISFSAWGGLWTPCAGSVTPWNSRLGGEEVRQQLEPQGTRVGGTV
jgi:hypothetical protein